MSWSMKDLLLRGAPWEILPDDRLKVDAAARRYSRDPHLSKKDRDYIARVWLPPEPVEPEPLPFGLPRGWTAMIRGRELMASYGGHGGHPFKRPGGDQGQVAEGSPPSPLGRRFTEGEP